MSGDPYPKPPPRSKKLRRGMARPGDPLAEWCQIAVEGACQGRATNRHHKLLRTHGGTDEPSNTLDVCGTGTTGCHGHIHANPEWAYRMGYLTRSSSPYQEDR